MQLPDSAWKGPPPNPPVPKILDLNVYYLSMYYSP
jgi:hypothetical protein